MDSEWKTIRLDAIAVLNPERRVAKGVEAPFIDMAALPQYARDIQFVNIERRTAKGSGAHFHNGDTLLARITPCLENGKTAQVRCLNHSEVGEGSTEFIVLSGIDSADNDFVYYLCRDTTFREYAIGRMEGTSGRQRVSWHSISAYEFLCPPKNVRRAAAELLSILDDRITLLHETNATLEAIAQALFKSWFVDFDPVRAKMEGRTPEGMDKATAALFPDGLEESALGLVPRGWKVSSIGDAVNTEGGATPDTKNLAYWDPPKHCWTSPKDLSGHAAPVLLDTARKLSAQGLEKISSGLLPKGTLLLSSRAPIGYLALAQVPLAINQGYIAMPPGGLLSPLYMLFWCRQNMEGIKGRANGSTFMEISKKAFRPIPTLLPPPEVVQKFTSDAGALFDRLIASEQQAKILAILRDTLLPKLFSGELSVDAIHHEEGA
ncbi:restriction endonuclease subunit S [Verminephrobacter aporrectodeae subsp. tuberculatae]|uniref:restriction endonuclease subunit S n=1 Tax=Verminephrobacter aporrectodeae TaxID=1110389 RepID=UPI0003200B20|nr:restriction endonuclease subunit S [Verminephrobacter aporrectodeae]MCW5257219.1 restriction endonuclease subunit S [Verminephrobacter aporrectodeae subsp. tuberculatae]